MIEERATKVFIGKAGGTAGKNSVVARVTLPAAWVKKLKITPDSRGINLIFDGEQIVIQKRNGKDSNAKFRGKIVSFARADEYGEN